MGTLTWTDGKTTRFIRCRCTETPLPKEVLPFLFKATIKLVADSPYWLDGTENIVTLSSGESRVVINNDCGLSVPFLLDVPSGTDAFAMASVAAGANIALLNTLDEGFTIDTAACTVTTASGELVNHQLSVESEFFPLMPGENVLNFAGANGITLRWRRAFMGVI